MRRNPETLLALHQAAAVSLYPPLVCILKQQLTLRVRLYLQPSICMYVDASTDLKKIVLLKEKQIRGQHNQESHAL